MFREVGGKLKTGEFDLYYDPLLQIFQSEIIKDSTSRASPPLAMLLNSNRVPSASV